MNVIITISGMKTEQYIITTTKNSNNIKNYDRNELIDVKCSKDKD